MNHEQQAKPAGAVPPPRLPDPSDIVRDATLSRAEKLEKLRRWRQDAQELEVANEEGMGGHVVPSNLDAIERALRELGADSSAGHP